MIPQIYKAELVRDDMWLVWFQGYGASRFIPAVPHPSMCPGGTWCADFGCWGNRSQ